MKHFFAQTLQFISFKNDVYFLQGQIWIKGNLISKSHTFLRYKTFNREVTNLRFCLVEDVTYYRDLRWIKVSNGAKIRNRYNQVPHQGQE